MSLRARLNRLEHATPLARCPQCRAVFFPDGQSATETPQEVLADIERKLGLSPSRSGKKTPEPEVSR